LRGEAGAVPVVASTRVLRGASRKSLSRHAGRQAGCIGEAMVKRPPGVQQRGECERLSSAADVLAHGSVSARPGIRVVVPPTFRQRCSEGGAAIYAYSTSLR